MADNAFGDGQQNNDQQGQQNNDQQGQQNNDQQGQQNSDQQGQQNSDQQGQQGQQSWLDSMPEDIKNSPLISKYDSVESLAKGLLNAQALIGRDKIPVPKTEEDWNDVYNKLGRPKEDKDYKFSLDGLPESILPNDEELGMYKKMFHASGLSQTQAEKLFKGYMEQVKSTYESEVFKHNDAIQKSMNALKLELGDEYNATLNVANRVVSEFGDDETVQLFQDLGLSKHPQMIKLFASIGKQFAESGGLPAFSQQGNQNPQSIKDEITQLSASPAYLDKKNPEHNSIVRRVEALYEKLYPSQG